MQGISDDALLSQLALPGTHDSATFTIQNSIVSDIGSTQVLSIDQQLKAGIRVFDIRIKHKNNNFPLYHGFIFLGIDFGEILNAITNFLSKHSKETVIIALSREGTSHYANNNRKIQETLFEYLGAYNEFFFTSNREKSLNMTLGSTRGKFIIMSDVQQFSEVACGFLTQSYIQNLYELSSIWKLPTKWDHVEGHLLNACRGYNEDTSINFLSAAYGSFPYIFATGRFPQKKNAPRLLTGSITWFSNNTYPPCFPRVGCIGELCSIAFEGINILTRDLLASKDFQKQCERPVGIILSDFPGPALITEIIANNKFVNNFTLEVSDKNIFLSQSDFFKKNYRGPNISNLMVFSGSIGFSIGIIQSLYDFIKKKNPHLLRVKKIDILEGTRILMMTSLNFSSNFYLSSTHRVNINEPYNWNNLFISYSLTLFLEILRVSIDPLKTYYNLNDTSLINLIQKITSYLFIIYPLFLIFFGDNPSDIIDNIFFSLVQSISCVLGYVTLNKIANYLNYSEKKLLKTLEEKSQIENPINSLFFKQKTELNHLEVDYEKNVSNLTI